MHQLVLLLPLILIQFMGLLKPRLRETKIKTHSVEKSLTGKPNAVVNSIAHFRNVILFFRREVTSVTHRAEILNSPITSAKQCPMLFSRKPVTFRKCGRNSSAQVFLLTNERKMPNSTFWEQEYPAISFCFPIFRLEQRFSSSNVLLSHDKSSLTHYKDLTRRDLFCFENPIK